MEILRAPGPAIIFLTLGVGGLPALCVAQGGQITGQLGCMVVTNTTGQTVNDFHFEFMNYSAGAVDGIYQNGWTGLWNPINGSSGFEVNYTGNTVAPGGKSSFGIRTNFPQPPFGAASAFAYWTLNGTQVGARIPVPNFTWIPVTSGGGGSTTGLQTNLHHFDAGTQSFLVQRRAVTTEEIVDFDSLLSPLMYESAALLDAAPLLWNPGQDLSHEFAWNGVSGQTFVMIYDLFDLSGNRVSTILESSRMEIPAPGAGALLGLAGLLATRRRRAEDARA